MSSASWCARRRRRKAIVTIVEDLHWIDEASEVLLGELVGAVEGTQTLAIVNFRPEYEPAWTGPANYRQIALEPLGTADTAELLRDLAGEDPSLDGLAELIHERTAGNPFFVEEIVRELAEAGGLEGERGAYRLVRAVEDAACRRPCRRCSRHGSTGSTRRPSGCCRRHRWPARRCPSGRCGSPPASIARGSTRCSAS